MLGNNVMNLKSVVRYRQRLGTGLRLFEDFDAFTCQIEFLLAKTQQFAACLKFVNQFIKGHITAFHGLDKSFQVLQGILEFQGFISLFRGRHYNTGN